MTDKKKMGTAASVALAGLVVAAGATAAITANADTPSATPSASASARATPGQQRTTIHNHAFNSSRSTFWTMTK